MLRARVGTPVDPFARACPHRTFLEPDSDRHQGLQDGHSIDPSSLVLRVRLLNSLCTLCSYSYHSTFASGASILSLDFVGVSQEA
jgi:hypothetical protein